MALNCCEGRPVTQTRPAQASEQDWRKDLGVLGIGTPRELWTGECQQETPTSQSCSVPSQHTHQCEEGCQRDELRGDCLLGLNQVHGCAP